jgi:hypothetical protein
MPTRRSFLGLAGAGALAAASSPLLAEPTGRRSGVRSGTVTDTWDVSWMDRVKGKHKVVFDSPEVSDGAGLFRAIMWADQLKEVYGTPRSDVSSVLVLRHAAIPLAMNDAYWSRFNVGRQVKMKDPSTKRWFTTNPLSTTPAGMPPKFAAYNAPAFLADGGIILACGLALQQIVGQFAKADKLSHEDAEKKARENMLPGVILQPSGVFAVLSAQEAGCSYIMAS